MKNLSLPQTDLTASNIILGLMRISDLSDEEIRTLVKAALDEGITMFDHADIYGGTHGCEARFGDAVKFTPAERERVVVQTKAVSVPATTTSPGSTSSRQPRARSRH